MVLATKIGGSQWDYDTMRKKLEGSLAKLKTDFVDLYMIHWPKAKGRHGNTSNMDDKDYEDIYGSMNRLRREGLISTGGLSNFRLNHLKKFKDEAFKVIVVDQVPYSLLWRAYDDGEIASFCRKKGLRYLAYSSLAQGFLTAKYGKGTALAETQERNVLFTEPVYSRAMKVVEAIKEVAEEVDATPAQVALKWVIDRELIASALVGIRRLEEIEENVEAIDINLTREQMGRLDKASLEFWAPMPPELEMWIHTNRKSNLESIGIRKENLAGKALDSFEKAYS